jgi:membrane protein DedA with SNARE-associated domain
LEKKIKSKYMKALVIFFAIVGSYAGSAIPLVWSGAVFSISSVLLGAIGGFLGIWIGYILGKRIGIS